MESTLRLNNNEKTVVHPELEKNDEEYDRRYRRWKRRVPAVIAWALVVLIVAFLVLYISRKVGQFESIPDMLFFIGQHLRGVY